MLFHQSVQGLCGRFSYKKSPKWIIRSQERCGSKNLFQEACFGCRVRRASEYES